MASVELEVEDGSGERAAERDRVISWRVLQLSRAGYAWHAAVVLAWCQDVDLHEAVRLRRAGCSQETALRILL